MKAPIDGFWAKLTRNDKRDVETWHPLVSHCADVAASLHVLLEETVLGERLARSADLPNLHPHLIQRLCFLAALHDVGKANHGFQRRAYSTRQEPGARAGHLSVVIDLVSDQTQTKLDLIDALGLLYIAGWFDAEEGLIQMLLATWGHHGAPIAPNASGLDSTLWRGNSTRSPLDGVRELIDAARGWFPVAFPHPRCQTRFNCAILAQGLPRARGASSPVGLLLGRASGASAAQSGAPTAPDRVKSRAALVWPNHHDSLEL